MVQTENLCQVFISMSWTNQRTRPLAEKGHKTRRTPTHNVIMDSILVRGGKEDPLPVKSLILLQAS